MILAALGSAVLLACFIIAGRQLQYWKNSDTLFVHNLEVTPDNFVARATYAAYFYNEKELDRAIDEAQKCIRINPNYAMGHTVLGNALLRQGNSDQAAVELRRALAINPSAMDARLGYGKALLGQNQPTEAEQQITVVLSADPGQPDAMYWLGRALLKEGNLAGAIAQFAKCASLARKFPDAQFQLAAALARQGRTKEAMENYRVAKNVPTNAPDYDVMNNLAWVLAASPLPENRDGAKAVELAMRARELDPSQQPVIIGTLAAAYAEAGRFDDAVAAAQQAHDLALAQGAKELAARNQELLELYRAHKAYHETLDFKP
jgi:tetratricopeptide (TPR) repeat protein